MYHHHHISTSHQPSMITTHPTSHSLAPPPPTNPPHPLFRLLHSVPHRLAPPPPCDPTAGTPRSVALTPSTLRSSTSVVRNTGAALPSAPSRCRVSVWLTGTLVTPWPTVDVCSSGCLERINLLRCCCDQKFFKIN